MGTNYYLTNKKCVTCGNKKGESHIGKSSCGWQFHFRAYRRHGIVSWKDWLEEFKNEKKEIYDEYGELISIDDFIAHVISKKTEALNPYNMISHKPTNEIEREYFRKRPYLPRGLDIEESSWNDDEGFSFTDQDFC
jgi:hypothetical protein